MLQESNSSNARVWSQVSCYSGFGVVFRVSFIFWLLANDFIIALTSLYCSHLNILGVLFLFSDFSIFADKMGKLLYYNNPMWPGTPSWDLIISSVACFTIITSWLIDGQWSPCTFFFFLFLVILCHFFKCIISLQERPIHWRLKRFYIKESQTTKRSWSLRLILLFNANIWASRLACMHS